MARCLLVRSRPLLNDTTTARRVTQPAEPDHRLLLASHDSRAFVWLEPSLTALNVEVLTAESGGELERTLFQGGPFDLVVASAQIAGPSGLQVLAKARTHGIRTPFIIIMSYHGELVRVMVSDVSNATLSSRMVDMPNFVALAMNFVRPPARPSAVPRSSPPGPRESEVSLRDRRRGSSNPV